MQDRCSLPLQGHGGGPFYGSFVRHCLTNKLFISLSVSSRRVNALSAHWTAKDLLLPVAVHAVCRFLILSSSLKP